MMLARSMSIAMALVLSLVVGTEADAAKPIQTMILPVILPNITASGEIDMEAPGVEALALVEVYYKRGTIELRIEAYGDVENAYGRRVRVTDPTGFEMFFPGPEVEVKKFNYTVSGSGRAVLKATLLADEFFIGPV